MNAAANLISSAPLSRSFPLDVVRDATIGLSLILVGQASESLRLSLPAARARRVLNPPSFSLSESEQIEYLRQGLSGFPRSDWTIVTDIGCADALMGNPDLLFALRQRTLCTLVLPRRFDQQDLAVSRYRGFAQEEIYDYGCWRWIASPDGAAELEIWSPKDLAVIWSFTPIFCSPATDRGVIGATLRIDCGGRSQSLEIRNGGQVALPLSLRRGPNLVGLSSDLPPSSSPTDSRTLSLAIGDPQVADDAGLLLDSVHFLAGARGGPLGRGRGLLHAAGFEHVAGVVCGSGHIPMRSALTASRSSPLHMILESDTTFDEPTIEPDDTAWLFCGEPMP